MTQSDNNIALPQPVASALAQSSLPSLDGIRALAVMLVVIYHAGLPVNGGLGVTMFFVLSGFLITWLLLKEQQKWGGISLRLFYLRRSLRIFPAFYCFWLVVVALNMVTKKPPFWEHAITAFLYLGNYYQALSGEWTTPLFHTWSLAIEEQFYLLWPALFIALKSNRSRLRWLLVAIPCFWLYRLVLTMAGVPEGYIYAALDTRADHLLAGCALAVLFFEGQGARFARAVTGHGSLVIVTLALLALSSAATTIFAYQYRNTIGFIVDPLLTVVLIVQGLAFRPPWLNWSPVRYIGRISYSIYLYHMLAVSVAYKVLPGIPTPLRLIGAIIATITVASLSFYVIERPFLVLKERFGQRKQSGSRATTAIGYAK